MSLLTRWPEYQLCLSEAERQHAVRALERAFASTLESLKVDIGLVDMFEAIYVPLAAWIVCYHRRRGAPLVVGLNGAQGAGKSTLFTLLDITLSEGFGLRVAGFSIDDLYKTRAERERLAAEVHPLLRTRGVPGSHDVELGIELLRALKRGEANAATRIPVFDKSTDDRCPVSVWQEWVGAADVVVLEGWCLGARAQDEAALQRPVNALEREEDPDGTWRRYVNEQLKGPYAELFSLVDVMLMLRVPSMDAVFEWRSLQEKKLAERMHYLLDTEQSRDPLRIMGEAEILRFIQHYERLTRSMLDDMPARADVTLHLNDNHKICHISINAPLAECGSGR
jgi:D-glycerate 3-kinase